MFLLIRKVWSCLVLQRWKCLKSMNCSFCGMLKGFTQRHYNYHSRWDKTWGRFYSQSRVSLGATSVRHHCAARIWLEVSPQLTSRGESGSTFPYWRLALLMAMCWDGRRVWRDYGGRSSQGERKMGKGCFSELIQSCFLINNKEWRENEIEVKDKKNLLKAGQSCHANKDFKWKI